MSGDNRPVRKQAKRLEKAVRVYGLSVREYQAARAKVAGVLDSGKFMEQSAALDVQAGVLRQVRETLLEDCRLLGVGLPLPEIVA